MIPNIKEFISDFKASGIVEKLCEKYEVLLIWVSGSTALGFVDEESDYDLGVLIADDIYFPKTEKTQIYFRYKKENNRPVQYIPNTLEDIFAELERERMAPYRYLGWAQFRCLSEDHIIYKNKKYENIVDELIKYKNQISANAIHTLLNFFDDALLSIKNPSDVRKVSWGKMLSHLCWCADALKYGYSPVENYVRLKRVPAAALTDLEVGEAFERLLFLQEYLQTPKEILKLPFLRGCRKLHIQE